MSKKELSSSLESVTKIATASKFMRMLNNPYKYFNAILFRELIYQNSKKGKEIMEVLSLMLRCTYCYL